MRAVWSEERVARADREARAVAEEGGDGAAAFADALSVLDAEELEVDCREARRLASSCGCWRCRGDRVFAGAPVCVDCGDLAVVRVDRDAFCGPCGVGAALGVKAVTADG